MTVIYIEDGMRVAEPESESQERDVARWFPGASPSDVVDTPINPVTYRAAE